MIYRDLCDSYRNTRFFSPDENKSYCSVEAVLLEVRKGIISKSIVTTQDYFVKKSNKDINFRETVQKSKMGALSKALGEIAKEIVGYLKNVPIS